MFLLRLSILHCSGKAYNEFLSYTFDAIGIFTLSIFFFVSALFFQMHYLYSKGLGRLGAFQLL